MKKHTAFTIGADPEFLIRRAGGTCLKSGNFKESNCLGSDGGGRAFELRPDFSTDPLKVVDNIHKNLIQLVCKRPLFLNHEWIAKSYVTGEGQPLGGHIHFGNFRGNVSTINIVSWLDQYLGSLSILLEIKKLGKLRREHGYGGFGDRRNTTYGFEYRTPSTWLSSPYVTAAVLCLAKTIVHHALTRRAVSPVFVDMRVIRNMDTKHVHAKFPQIWEGIEIMELYPDYKQHIDLLRTLILNGRSWHPKQNMQTAWGVLNIEKQKTRAEELSIDKIWADV